MTGEAPVAPVASVASGAPLASLASVPLIPLGDANAVVCDGDVCYIPGTPAR